MILFRRCKIVCIVLIFTFISGVSSSHSYQIGLNHQSIVWTLAESDAPIIENFTESIHISGGVQRTDQTLVVWADIWDIDGVDTALVSWQLSVREPNEWTDSWKNTTLQHVPTNSSRNTYLGNITFSTIGVSKLVLLLKFMANDTLGNWNETTIQAITMQDIMEPQSVIDFGNLVLFGGVAIFVSICCYWLQMKPNDEYEFYVEGQ